MDIVDNISTSGKGFQIFLIIGIVILVIFVAISIILSILAFINVGSIKNMIANQPANMSGPAGPAGPVGPGGPPGPKGTFNFIGSSNITGLYRNNDLVLPFSNSKIPVTKTAENNMVFVLNNLLTDNKGQFFVKTPGVYQFNMTIDTSIGTGGHEISDEISSSSDSKGMILRVYNNDVIVSYYEILESGSQSLNVPIQCKAGDVIRFGIISQDDNINSLIQYGTILTVLSG